MRHLLTILLAFFISNCILYAADYEIVKNTTHYSIKGNKTSRTDTVVMKINNRMGEEEILVPYSKGDKISIVDAWIEDRQGNIVRKLKNKEIEDRSYISNISLYEDDFVKAFYLKHNDYPYYVSYSTQISYRHSLGQVHIDLSDNLIPIQKGRLIVEIPVEDSIRYKASNVEIPEMTISGNNKIYIWNYSHTPPPERELNASPNLTEAPVIDVVSLNFKFGESGSFDSWQSFGNWVYRLNKGRDILPPEELTKIDKLLTGISEPKQKIAILYRYLQEHTRYINVSMHIGGLQTYPASYVSTHKYGDCKALTNYMQSMLKYIGVPSYYTLIEAGDRVRDIATDFPMQAFNHAILTVPLDKDTLFLECTSKNNPLGYLGTFTQNRYALLIDENDSRLIKTPALTVNEVACSRRILIKSDTEEVTLAATQRGNEFERFSYLANELNKSAVDRYIRSQIVSGTYEVSDYILDKSNSQQGEIHINARLIMPNIGKTYGNNIILEPFSLKVPSYETPDKRTSSLQLDYPQYHTDTIVYEFGEQVIGKIPDNILLESPYGRYSLIFQAEKGRLSCLKAFLLYAGRYSLSEYKTFYDFITQVKSLENKKVYIESL